MKPYRCPHCTLLIRVTLSPAAGEALPSAPQSAQARKYYNTKAAKKVRKLLLSEPNLKVAEIMALTDCPKSTVYRILKKIQYEQSMGDPDFVTLESLLRDPNENTSPEDIL